MARKSKAKTTRRGLTGPPDTQDARGNLELFLFCSFETSVSIESPLVTSEPAVSGLLEGEGDRHHRFLACAQINGEPEDHADRDTRELFFHGK